MWYALSLYIFAVTCVLSVFFTRRAGRWALKHGMIDMPGDRKAHDNPTPLLGGLGLMAAMLCVLLVHGLALYLVAVSSWGEARIPPALAVHIAGALSVIPKLATIMLGGVLIFLLGLWDDFADIKPRVKLLGQIMVALVIVALNVRITLFIPHFFLSTIITVLWIVVIINAFNLLDNMDGLCAGVAIIASAVFWGVSVSQGNYFIALLLALLIGALAGFLRYNFHPARIFMGDAGSMLIGYFVAVLTIMQTYYNEGKAESLAVLMPLVILAVPLYDTASVVLIRIVRGESIFKADRRHFSHRLVDLGMTQWGAVLFIYLVTLCTGLSATLLRRVGWMGGTVILVQTFFIVLIIALLEYYGGKRIAK